MNQLAQLLQDRFEVEFYLPLEVNAHLEVYLIKLQDAICQYLYPLSFGLHKNDLIEFWNNDIKSIDEMLSFLIFKRYVSFKDDINKEFFNFISNSYENESSIKICCSKIIINNIPHSYDVLSFQKDLSEIINAIYCNDAFDSTLNVTMHSCDFNISYGEIVNGWSE